MVPCPYITDFVPEDVKLLWGIGPWQMETFPTILTQELTFVTSSSTQISSYLCFMSARKSPTIGNCIWKIHCWQNITRYREQDLGGLFSWFWICFRAGTQLCWSLIWNTVFLTSKIFTLVYGFVTAFVKY